MKVLWLCNIMLPVIAEYFHLEASNKEGWLSGLAAEVLKRKKENGIGEHGRERQNWDKNTAKNAIACREYREKCKCPNELVQFVIVVAGTCGKRH